MHRQTRPCRHVWSQRGPLWAMVAVIVLLPILMACGRDEASTPTLTSPNPGVTATDLGLTTPAAPDDATPQPFQRRPVSLVILHTNDVAGEIDPCG